MAVRAKLFIKIPLVLLPEAAGLCAGAVVLACLQEMERLQVMKQEYIHRNTVSLAVGLERA